MRFENYNVFRCDRNSETSSSKLGGGVLIAVRDDVSSVRIPDVSSTLEQLFVHLPSLHMVIGAVYIPYPTKELLSLHSQDICAIQERLGDVSFVMTGDYNLPNHDWAAEPEDTSFAPQFFNDLALLNLVQFNSVPNIFGSLLDLVFSNLNFVKVQCNIDPLLPLDDFHPALLLELTDVYNSKDTRSKSEFLNYSRGDYWSLNLCLNSIDWHSTLNSADIDVNVTRFYDIINFYINLFIPRVTPKPRSFPYWYSADLIRTINAKKAQHRIYKQTLSAKDYCEFSKLRAETKRLQALCEKNYSDYITSHLPFDSKPLWKQIQNVASLNK